MTWISKSITTFGLVLLAHACYSAHEHSVLQQSTASPSAAASSSPSGTGAAAVAAAATATAASSSLPVDISIETVVALVVMCLGLALGTPLLRPIQWREWAGKIEREGAEGFFPAGGDSEEVAREFIGNPFRYLESRPAFVDIRKQRKEFACWVKSGAEPKA
ncbi:hypothetical protein GGTG_01300 [Gaeumannomyces tritici R3-111a-1]|uniref:Transmembrane protein 32 n=1 Tax=Gaeumannomyces tritici (strain R3-111a-1) TaxID=644352 RepID=J3NJ66_GAET3|nr:hypothetical protein GGTG_01300 [Gaeumannomyces tritici R3-111a-1]EJT81317.1 hypothetical protein GGTG_01300 [Gaeumannomyces tritici R3-111a-1]